MEKILLPVSLAGVLFLDWAALDDITTGNEPSQAGEYLMLIVSVPLLFFIIRKFSSKKLKL